jgi:hypothetical protein
LNFLSLPIMPVFIGLDRATVRPLNIFASVEETDRVDTSATSFRSAQREPQRDANEQVCAAEVEIWQSGS